MGEVHTVFTEVAHGDLRIDGDPAELESRRASVSRFPWTWLAQPHGAEVVVVGAPGEHRGAAADGAVTDIAGVALAVQTADCAPLLLWSPEGVVGAAHAGWRGLYDGIVENTVAAMEELGASSVSGRVGPTVGPGAYEFSRPDLTRMALRFGPDVVAATDDGRPALDMYAAVVAVCDVVGVELLGGRPPCTATGGRWFSWRARRDTGRQASVIWRDP